jgi:hypothetical protein
MKIKNKINKRILIIEKYGFFLFEKNVVLENLSQKYLLCCMLKEPCKIVNRSMKYNIKNRNKLREC